MEATQTPSTQPIGQQSGKGSTRRLFATAVSLAILIGGAVVIWLITGVNHRGVDGVARLSIFLVTVMTLAVSWGFHRLIRSRDPEDDIRHPTLLDQGLIWLLNQWDVITAPPAVYAERERNREYLAADRRGFPAFFSDEVVSLRRLDESSTPGTPRPEPEADLDMPGGWEELTDPRGEDPEPARRFTASLRRRPPDPGADLHQRSDQPH